MRLNIRERCQKVFQVCSTKGQLTIRALAQATGMSKSSVHRHQQAMKRRQQQPESGLWESPVGAQWLKRLVVATIFVFCFKRGVGCESLVEFFRLLGLERHVGLSVGSLRQIRTQMETQILDYQRLQQSQLEHPQTPVAACISVDETFFDQVVLVMLDLPSGFILVEELSQDYRYETWQQHTQQVLSKLGLNVHYCVSDRAKALVKLARREIGCPSIADLFHALRDLSQGLGSERSDRLFRVNRRLRELHDTAANAPLRQQLQVQQSPLEQAQQQYRASLHQLTTTLHPFALRLGLPPTSKMVATACQQQATTLRALKQTYQLTDKPGSLSKFERQQHDLAAVVALWWEWVRHSLSVRDCDPSTWAWVEQQLLPAFYWHQQTVRTKTPTLKAAYQSATQQAQAAFMRHPLTATLSSEQ